LTKPELFVKDGNAPKIHWAFISPAVIRELRKQKE
jgi:hypothetical protein